MEKNESSRCYEKIHGDSQNGNPTIDEIEAFLHFDPSVLVLLIQCLFSIKLILIQLHLAEVALLQYIAEMQINTMSKS